MNNDYCGECGFVNGGTAVGCDEMCPSPKGLAMAHEMELEEALRPKVAKGEFLRIRTIASLPENEQDTGNLWAIANEDVTICGEDDILPYPLGAEMPCGFVSWDSGTCSAVPLEFIEVLR